MEMARVLNEYFVSFVTREDLSSTPTINEETQKEVLSDIDVTEERVLKAVNLMKPNKTAGVDGLGLTFVEESLKGILEPLVSLMKGSLNDTVVPDDCGRPSVRESVTKNSHPRHLLRTAFNSV